MPSPSHQNFIFVLREHPELVASLARCAGIPIPGGDRVVVEAGAEFDIPVALGRTLRADLALAGRDPAADAGAGARERCRWSLAVEVQLRPDPSKRWTTPHYRTGLAHNLRCPAYPLVFSPDPKVRRSIRALFEDDSELAPYIVEPWMLPPIRDLDAAIAAVGHAVLAATLHADDPEAKAIAKVALQAVVRAAPREPSRYVQLITNGIGSETMKQIITELPEEDREPLTEWERRGASFVRGKEEGVEEGLATAHEEARATLLAVMAARGFELTPDLLARLDACDRGQLRALTVRAATVHTLAALMTEPDR